MLPCAAVTLTRALSIDGAATPGSLTLKLNGVTCAWLTVRSGSADLTCGPLGSDTVKKYSGGLQNPPQSFCHTAVHIPLTFVPFMVIGPGCCGMTSS